MARYYIDTETCGLHGVPVLLQYAIDDGPVILVDLWSQPMIDTMELIEEIFANDVVGFNLAFDIFHLIKLYLMFTLYPDKNHYPEDHIQELAIIEEKARFVDLCLKPKSALDLMLVARKTKYQSLMAREPLRIRKVPTALAWQLAEELERRIQFDQIYFANRKDPNAPKWKVFDIKRPDGGINPDFKDLKLSFSASGSLKNLYRHAFKVTEKFFTYGDIEIDRKLWPKELGYAPFALALAPDAPKTGNWKGTWPEVIHEHILHWKYNKDARTYASNDIVYTRRLAVEHFNNPECGDTDSTLACMVAACRWRGYDVDLNRIGELKYKALIKIGFEPGIALAFKHRRVHKDHIKKYGKTLMAPKSARVYILQALTEEEQLGIADIKTTTKKTILEELAKWRDDNDNPHPVSFRAREVLDARFSQKEIELYDKIQRAGRFHASFKVTGALSNRMAGADGLNPQGINHKKIVRRAFTLADQHRIIKFKINEDCELSVAVPKSTLCGGDFKSYEVALAATVFNDPDLTAAIQSGIKVHGIMATKINPGMTYEEALASEGTAEDWYSKGKQGFFLKVYFGEAYTFHTKLGIPMDVAEEADRDFNKQFPNVAKFQNGVRTMFGALSQPGGLGTKVEWKEPAEYAESFLGFRRYFTLEIRVMKALFDLAQNPPPLWKTVAIKVLRREKMQTAAGAVASALYGAAFAIMSAMIRAAGNHFIQSPGATIAKETQVNIWSVQPVGIHPWIVQPFNVHDEIMTPVREGYEQVVEDKAQETVTFFKKQVPLLAIDWMKGISSWAGKKGDIPDEPEVSEPAGSSIKSVA